MQSFRKIGSLAAMLMTCPAPRAGLTPALADAGAFIPEVWAQRGLDLLKPLLPVTRRIAKDTKFTDQFNTGDVLNIDVPGRFNAPRKTTTGTVSTQTPRGLTKVQVSLSEHRTTDFMVYDVTSAQSSPRLMDSLMQSAIAGMARAIEQSSIAALMAGSYSNGTAGVAITGATWRGAMTALNNRLIPETGRNMILSPKDYSAALADSELKGYFEKVSPEALRQAELGMIYGFDTFMSQLTPATAVQRLNFVGGSNGETFRLVWNGFETADIAFNSTAATLVSNIQTALRAMTDPITMGSGTVSVAGSAITAIDVTFASTALYYPSALLFSVEAVAGTPYAGTCTVADQGTVTTTNIAFHEDAAIFVPRQFKPIPVGAGVTVSQVADDDMETGTGITMRVIGQYSMQDRGYRIGLDVLYGAASLRTASAQLVLC